MKSVTHLQVYTISNKHVGHFDGEKFYTNPAIPLRVDGIEVYTDGIPAILVGYVKDNQIELLDGSKPYYFK